MNFDEQLNITTSKEDYQFPRIAHYHRYEPTDEQDLVTLADFLKAHIHKHDVLIDFGSGLMRVPIVINHLLGIRTIGVEMNKALYLEGQKNIERYQSDLVQSVNINAINYQFSGEETILFFFNPFSSEIFRTVIHHFLQHYNYRTRVFVVLYYAKLPLIDVIEQFGMFHEIKRYELNGYAHDENDTMIIYSTSL